MTLNATRPSLVPRRCYGRNAVRSWVKPGVQAYLQFGSSKNKQYEKVRVVKVEGDRITVRQWIGDDADGEWYDLTVGQDRIWTIQPHAPQRAR